MTTQFFFYGTLMSRAGRSRFTEHLARPVGPAKVAGQLYDVGAFPAMIDGDGTVTGELWEANDAGCLPALFDMLDRIEGYDAAHPERSMYLRVERPLIEPEGTVWTYVWNYSTERMPHIWHGDWRRYRADAPRPGETLYDAAMRIEHSR